MAKDIWGSNFWTSPARFLWQHSVLSLHWSCSTNRGTGQNIYVSGLVLLAINRLWPDQKLVGSKSQPFLDCYCLYTSRSTSSIAQLGIFWLVFPFPTIPLNKKWEKCHPISELGTVCQTHLCKAKSHCQKATYGENEPLTEWNLPTPSMEKEQLLSLWWVGKTSTFVRHWKETMFLGNKAFPSPPL